MGPCLFDEEAIHGWFQKAFFAAICRFAPFNQIYRSWSNFHINMFFSRCLQWLSICGGTVIIVDNSRNWTTTSLKVGGGGDNNVTPL